VNVQNRVASVLDELPEEAIKSGVIVEKVQNSMLLYVNLFSTDATLDENFLFNFNSVFNARLIATFLANKLVPSCAKSYNSLIMLIVIF
jgi:multidrug efflux pump subunit AcrB